MIPPTQYTRSWFKPRIKDIKIIKYSNAFRIILSSDCRLINRSTRGSSIIIIIFEWYSKWSIVCNRKGSRSLLLLYIRIYFSYALVMVIGASKCVVDARCITKPKALMFQQGLLMPAFLLVTIVVASVYDNFGLHAFLFHRNISQICTSIFFVRSRYRSTLIRVLLIFRILKYHIINLIRLYSIHSLCWAFDFFRHNSQIQ